MSTNNRDRNVSACIECREQRANVHGLWCDDCWSELNPQHSGALICAMPGCEQPVTAGTPLCHACLEFYAPAVSDVRNGS